MIFSIHFMVMWISYFIKSLFPSLPHFSFELSFFLIIIVGVLSCRIMNPWPVTCFAMIFYSLCNFHFQWWLLLIGIFNFYIAHIFYLLWLMPFVSYLKNPRSFTLPPLLSSRSFHVLPFRLISTTHLGLIFRYWIR